MTIQRSACRIKMCPAKTLCEMVAGPRVELGEWAYETHGDTGRFPQWWTDRDSNSAPRQCHCRVLPDELPAHGTGRVRCLSRVNETLSAPIRPWIDRATRWSLS